MLKKKIKRESSNFWKNVKDKRKNRQQNNEFVYNSKSVVGQQAIDAFAQYFSSVFQPTIPLLDVETAERDAMHTGCAANVSINIIKISEVRWAIRRLKASSAYGPDNIPAFLIKDCISILESPLVYVYNLSLRQCLYPSVWKVSRVTPVPKSGSSADVTNFRPIAILSVFAKIFECIINKSIYQQIGGLLDNCQHGFRPGRSTLTNHIQFMDYVTTRVKAGCQVDAAYFDFKKAFDLVDNDVLLNKFAALGFSTQLLTFMADYLRDRKQFVKLCGYVSQEYYTRSGVSQGSTLGPTQFLIMINDLPSITSKAKSLMFADDLKLFLSVRKVEDCIALQNDIDAVNEWSVKNKLTFNSSKCKTITLSRSRAPITTIYQLAGTPLERVHSIRDLGLTIDSNFNFHEHIIKTCKEANKNLGFIIRTSYQFKNICVMKLLYNAYVRSKLEYNAIIWNPRETLYTMMVEKVQRKFARCLYKRQYGYYPFLYPSIFVSGMVGLDTLQFRRSFMQIMHYYLLLANIVDNPGVRESIHFYVPDQYMRGVGRRQHRLLSRPPEWRSPHADNSPTSRAISMINCFVKTYPEVDIFIDKPSVMYKNMLAFLNT